MNNAWIDRISDYLDGDMTPAEREIFENRMAEDPELNVAVNEVRQLISSAHELESVEPTSDLWAGIQARIAPRAQPRRAGSPAPRRVQLQIWQLVAVAALVVLVSGAIGFMLNGLGRPTDGVNPVNKFVSVPMGASEAASFARLSEEEERLTDSITALEGALKIQGQYLDEETRAVVEDNLLRIDAAIRDAREALAGDPSSDFLHAHLATSMQRKVRLLEGATRLASNEI